MGNRRKRFILIFSLLMAALTLLIALPAAAGPAEPNGRGPVGAPPDFAQASITGTHPFAERPVRVLHRYSGENIFDGFGWIGANLGDLDGDGATDYLTTAPFYQQFATQEGRAYVYNGADGSLEAVHTGAPGQLLGYSAAGAGDVNGDGTPDYVIGAIGGAGRAVVYSGVDHTVLLDVAGSGGRFGSGVAGVGDVNGDGYGDLAVGAEFFDGGFPAGRGQLSLLSGADGSTLWAMTGESGDLLGTGVGRVRDLDGDGIDDVVVAARGVDGGNGEAYVLSGQDGALVRTLAPTQPGGSSTFGRFFARDAGDTNADGYADLFIGDYGAFGFAGRAYVYSGADGSALHVFGPEAANGIDGVGPGRGIPDVNGDGHDDIIVAGYLSGASTSTGGRVYIRSGVDGSILQQATGRIAGDNLGVDALPLGDVNGDGQPDYMLTAVGLDFVGLDVGHVYVVTFRRAPQAPVP